MTAKALRVSTYSIMAILLGILCWAVIADNFVVPAIAVLAAIGLTYVLRSRAKIVTRDERTFVLYEKAAAATIRMCVPLMAVVGIALLIFRESLSSQWVSVGYGLAFTASAMTMVHLAFLAYFSRKH